MENSDQEIQEFKNKIEYCLKKTYTNTDDVTRLESEYYLQQKMELPIFWDILLMIPEDEKNPIEMKKAAIIFMEQRVRYLISTKTFDEKMIKFLLGYLYKFLMIKKLPLKVKMLTRVTIVSIARVLSSMSFEVEETWEFYMTQFINRYRELKLSQDTTPDDVFAVVYFLSSFFEGVNEVSDNDIKFVYDFIVEIAKDVFELLKRDEECQNPTM